MWFLTVDPLIRVSVFIAKLSERQDCWSVFEDFHCQQKIQFFDINCGLSCVCTSPLAIMTIVGLHDFVKVSISKNFQVLFADHMHRRSGVDNKFSFLRFKELMQASTQEECCCILSLNFNTLLASFHAVSRAPCSCYSVSSWERSSKFGALGQR